MTYYDYIAHGYNELFGEEQRKKAQLISGLVDAKPDSRLLDVGCGTGICLGYFHCFRVGADPAIQLLKQSKHNPIQAIAEHLPFKDNSFDVVISVTAIHNFQDPQTGLREIKRVGKGKFVLTLIRSIKRFPELDSQIRRLFHIKETIQEDKDVVYVMTS